MLQWSYRALYAVEEGGYGMADFDVDDIEEIRVTLELEGEGEVECEVISIFEYDGSDYAALTPTDENVAELYFFGVEMKEDKDDMEITFENVEDEEFLGELAEAFDQLMNGDEENEIEAAIGMDSGDDDDEDDDDSKWDEFITKKL